MGRIKPTAVKRLGDELLEKNPGIFSSDFAKTKKVLDEVKRPHSKKVKNVLAGYIAKKVKRMEKPEN